MKLPPIATFRDIFIVGYYLLFSGQIGTIKVRSILVIRDLVVHYLLK